MKTRLHEVPTPEITLADLRAKFGLSQEQLGKAIGTSQPAVKKTEDAQDPRLSTLRRYVGGLGAAIGAPGRIEMHAILGKERYMIYLGTSHDIKTREREPLGSSPSTQAWRLRAWDEPAIEQAMIAGCFIAISADETGDLSDFPADDELRARLQAHPALAHRGKQAIGMFVGYWKIFLSGMGIGDLVAVPLSGMRVAIAEVTGDYQYRSGVAEPRLRHVRQVRWLSMGTPRNLLPEDILRVVNAPGTLCSFNAPDAAGRILTTIR